MKTHTKTLLASLAACSMIAAGSAQAATIFTEDFEGSNFSAVTEGTFKNGWANTDTSGIWGSTGAGSTLLNPPDSGNSWMNPAETATLGQVFGTLHGATEFADTGQTFLADTIYTLTFTHFRRDDLAGASVIAEFLTTGGSSVASDTFAAVTDTHTFETRTLTFDTSADNSFNGQEIRIQFSRGSGSQAGVDNISLDASPIPEPSSLALLGLGGLCVLRRRRQA